MRSVEDYIARHEYEEFQRRIEDESARQEKRIDRLEEMSRQIEELTISMEKMAASMQSVAAGQERQGERLKRLEEEPAIRWKESAKTMFHAFLSALGAAAACGWIYLLTATIK